METLLVILKIIWALPNTIFGIFFGILGVLTGGSWQRQGRTIEFWGGIVGWILKKFPIGSYGAAALTLGHVILAQDADLMRRSRKHENVHVKQYEHWGIFFLPYYFLGWLYLSTLKFAFGKDVNPYRDIPFEKEAYAVSEVEPPSDEMIA